MRLTDQVLVVHDAWAVFLPERRDEPRIRLVIDALAGMFTSAGCSVWRWMRALRGVNWRPSRSPSAQPVGIRQTAPAKSTPPHLPEQFSLYEYVPSSSTGGCNAGNRKVATDDQHAHGHPNTDARDQRGRKRVLEGQRGSQNLQDVKVEGESVSYKVQMKAMGQEFTLNCKATASGDELKGRMDTPMGSADFTGVRVS